MILLSRHPAQRLQRCSVSWWSWWLLPSLWPSLCHGCYGGVAGLSIKLLILLKKRNPNRKQSRWPSHGSRFLHLHSKQAWTTTWDFSSRHLRGRVYELWSKAIVYLVIQLRLFYEAGQSTLAITRAETGLVMREVLMRVKQVVRLHFTVCLMMLTSWTAKIVIKANKYREINWWRPKDVLQTGGN